jgi:D-alanyl-D-alanine carboxypeptidase/D-alanyl-D-alanine-endopeptidase (penicillin-binding protein 4)
VRAVLARLGVPVDGVELRDGSGLAPTNRVTCAALLQVVALGTRPPLDALDRGMPVAGRTGTLVDRYSGTPLEGRLRAKTGHINGVVGLAGVIDAKTTASPQPRFAFVANGSFSTEGGSLLQDRIAKAVDAYPDAPNAAELVPAP